MRHAVKIGAINCKIILNILKNIFLFLVDNDNSEIYEKPLTYINDINTRWTKLCNSIETYTKALQHEQLEQLNKQKVINGKKK